MRATVAAAVVVAIAAHGSAGADTPEPAPTHWLGMSGVLVPAGTLTTGSPDVSRDDSLALAYGATLVAERAILPNLSWMLAPRILTGLRPDDSTVESASQLDLRLGMRGDLTLRSQVHAFAYGAAGYSFIFLPDDPGVDLHPQGLLVAAGLGLGYRWTRVTTFTASLGYQIGFQEVDDGGGALIYKDRLLDVTVGFQAALD